MQQPAIKQPIMKQLGMSTIGLIIIVGIAGTVVVSGMKVAPAYIEYFAVKKALQHLSKESDFNNMSKNDMVNAFNKSAIIDNITSVTGKDIVVSKTASGGNIASIEYQVVKPLFANVSALIDFSVSTAP